MRPKISAECGQPVTLDCEVSSSQHGLLIKHMEWYQNNTSICKKIDSKEKPIMDPKQAANGFHCDYQLGKLSLKIENINPMNSGESKPFWCKLRSNKGPRAESTTVELQGQSLHLFLFSKHGDGWFSVAVMLMKRLIESFFIS